MEKSKPYVLDVEEGFIVEPPISLYYRDCYKVWPDKKPMPDFYGKQEILQAGSFQIFDIEEQALQFSKELGDTPVYWLRKEKDKLAVTRIR